MNYPTRNDPGYSGAWLVLAVIIGCLVIGCKSSTTEPPPKPKSVIVVVVDALRADHLGAYGYTRPTSPNVDELGRNGTTFLQAISSAPWTLPAMGTLWTSLYPSVHGAMGVSNLEKMVARPNRFRASSVLDESHTTLAEVLRSSGFSTAAFVDGSYPGAKFGFDQGFDHFVESQAEGIRLNVEALLRWLDKKKPERFFAYIHTIEVHSPYHAPLLRNRYRKRRDARADYVRKVHREESRRYASFAFDSGYDGNVDGTRKTLRELVSTGKRLEPRDLSHLEALYDAGIRYDDYWIGRLIEDLRRRDLYDSTIMVVTSDHGDEFFDHGGYEHMLTYYDEMLRIPLIIRVPGFPRGLRPTRQVGLMDLMPTLLDLFEIDPVAPMQGTSLQPLLEGGDLDPRVFYGEASASYDWDAAARSREEKFVRKRQGNELFDLNADPSEQHNLCPQNPDKCSRLANALTVWQDNMKEYAEALARPTAAPAILDDDALEQLRALGYVD